MRPTADLVRYLNDFFAVEVWRAAFDLIGNLTVSETDNFVRTLPLVNGLTETRVEFSRPPGVTAIDDAQVRVRLPRTGRHRLVTELVTDSPLPNADLEVEFEVGLTARAGAPQDDIDIAVEFSWFSDLLIGLLSPPALIAKRAIEEGIEEIIPIILEGKLRDRLGGLRTYRFDRTHDLAWADMATSAIRGAFRAEFAGSRDPAVPGCIDVLLVADGYAAADIHHFETFADRVRDHFAGALPEPLEAPFRQFRTAMRIWQMPLTANDPADRLQRAVFPVEAAGQNVLNFSNLARVAEIGLAARGFFGRDPIIVFASRVSVADRMNAGIDPSAGLRANTQGPYVPLDLPPAGGAEDATRVLVHELGHSPLGRYLADEYAAGDSPPKVYRGPEPRSRNVSLNLLRVTGWAKWQPWSGSLQTALTAPQNVGAYEHDEGIFRFQADCRMRNTTSGEFCPVCREELALGLLEASHEATGSQGVRGMLDLTVEYLSPWTEPQPRRLHLVGGNTGRLDVFAASGVSAPPTRVRLTLAGSSVPETWQTAWRVLPSGEGGTSGTLNGPSIEVYVRSGAVIEITVRHDLTATGILAPNRQVPETSGRLVFDVERRLTAAELVPPTNLTQSVGLGAVLAPVVDQATGALSLPQELWLAARLGRAQGYSLPTSVEFRLDGPGNFQRTHQSAPGAQGEERRWVQTRMLPPGHYVWSARTTWRGLAGGWVQAPRGATGYCFEIDDVPLDPNPRSPVDPFDLALLETATFPSLPVGLKATSWHPNDRPINFQFELKQQQHPWTGMHQLETGLLQRDRRNVETLAITGQVPFNRVPQLDPVELYTWRVRAVDDQGRASAWVEGRPFMIALPGQRPRTLEEFAEILERLDPRMLDPKGPRPIPRLFVAEGSPGGDQEVNLSALKRWGTERPVRRRPEREPRPPSDAESFEPS